MKNLKFYTKYDIMKKALEIEDDICDTILKHVDEYDEQMKMLMTANRFKSAIYEWLELSQESYYKICNEVIKEREKGKNEITK